MSVARSKNAEVVVANQLNNSTTAKAFYDCGKSGEKTIRTITRTETSPRESPVVKLRCTFT